MVFSVFKGLDDCIMAGPNKVRRAQAFDVPKISGKQVKRPCTHLKLR